MAFPIEMTVFSSWISHVEPRYLRLHLQRVAQENQEVNVNSLGIDSDW